MTAFQLLTSIVLVPWVIGCSDEGAAPWAAWTEYNLPYAQIYLPPALEL